MSRESAVTSESRGDLTLEFCTFLVGEELLVLESRGALKGNVDITCPDPVKIRLTPRCGRHGRRCHRRTLAQKRRDYREQDRGRGENRVAHNLRQADCTSAFVEIRDAHDRSSCP